MSCDSSHLTEIVDRSGQTVFAIAELMFDQKSRAFVGRVVSSNATSELTALLADLEDRVEGQSFAYVDDVQEKIDASDLIAKAGDKRTFKVVDLFVSRSGGISFREKCDRE